MINTVVFVFTCVFPQGHGHSFHSDRIQHVPEELEQQNQVQTLLPESHGHQRRWSHPQHRSVGVLPQPEPEEETKPFILDLNNFPDLANADINSQNPNIQVCEGVTDHSESDQFKMKLNSLYNTNITLKCILKK